MGDTLRLPSWLDRAIWWLIQPVTASRFAVLMAVNVTPLIVLIVVLVTAGGCSCGPEPTGASWSCEAHE